MNIAISLVHTTRAGKQNSPWMTGEEFDAGSLIPQDGFDDTVIEYFAIDPSKPKYGLPRDCSNKALNMAMEVWQQWLKRTSRNAAQN